MILKKLYTVYFFQHMWWVIAFSLFCAILYEEGLKKKENEFLLLKRHLLALEKEKLTGLALQADLNSQIQSQDDPEWIELTLMKEYGLVPEGYKKIYFK